MAFTLNCFTLGMFGLGLGSYMQALFPSIDGTMVAVVSVTLFFIANVIGVSFIAKI